MNHYWQRALWAFFSLTIFGFIIAGCVYAYLISQLPSVETLKAVQLQTPLRIYSSDEKLIAEYGEKRRIPVAYDNIPQPLIEAVLATEDRRFFEHPGVDIVGLLRASVQLVRTGAKSQGGSTITMQVARNFFLTRKKSFLRKINEILLAIKIDHKLSKEKILELYLNKIYFGNRAYGVAAAAEVYYGKTLSQLTLPEIAMLAGLPQAPSTHNPLTNPNAAKKRRNHVLERMYEEKLIDEKAYQTAIKAPLTEKYHGRKAIVSAPYVAEMIRQALYQHFGQETYTKGYKVYTTINSTLQNTANTALENGLLNYDGRHAYRGPVGYIDLSQTTQMSDWFLALKKFPVINDIYPVLITSTHPKTIHGILSTGDTLEIPLKETHWKQALLRLKTGDVIYARQIGHSQRTQQWELVQIPQVQGAFVALNPKNGAIVALTGGLDFYDNNFNHVTQAMRQPGSSFKPFIYAAALDKGFTLASVINDAPVVIREPGQDLWRPQNAERKFYGPTRLRTALTYSRNLVSIRLLEAIGIPYAVQYVQRFGFLPNQIPKTLSLALGTLEATPLQMAAAYAIFANGGYKVDPYIIDRVADSEGNLLLKAEAKIACPQCTNDPNNVDVPADKRAHPVISSQIAYLMTSALQDVINYGTGKAANQVLHRKDLAGKTGTTNDQKDAWFDGYTSDIVATVWVGFSSTPQSLHEYGAKAALPIWVEFMAKALENKPNQAWPIPDNIVNSRIDPATGLLANSHQANAIFEVFEANHLPAAAQEETLLPNGAPSSPYSPSNENDKPIF